MLTYSTLFGGSGPDRVTAAVLDRAGFVYLTGYVGVRDINATSAFPTDTNGDLDIFLAKIDPNASGAASLLYFTYIGGSGTDIPTAIAQDGLGNVYLTGSTTSINFPLAGGGPQNRLNEGVVGAAVALPTDAFVTMIRPSEPGLNGLYYSTYLGGSGADIGYGIAVDSQASIYVVGSTKSFDDPTTTDVNEGFPVTDAAYQKVSYGPGDAFIAKIVPTASPTLVFSSYLGGEQSDEGRAIAVSPSGAVYIAGNTYSTGLPPAGRAYSVTGGGNGDLFVAQLDLSKFGEATLIYMTFLGGSGFESVTKMTLDSADRVLLTGYTLSPDFPVTPNAFQTQLPGAANPFVTRLDLKAPGQSGLSYSTFLGGSNGDVPYDIAVDAAGAVYLTGYTVSTDFPVTPDALQSTLGGGIDVFVSKLKMPDSGPSSLLYSTYVGQTGVNVGYALAVSPDGKTIYVGGQTGANSIAATGSAFQGAYAGGSSDGFFLVLGAVNRTTAAVRAGWLWLALAGAVIVIYRAATQSFTIDESFVFQLFLDQKPTELFNKYDAAYHVLHTWATWLALYFLGKNEFVIRLPSVIAGLAYLAAVGVISADFWATAGSSSAAWSCSAPIR